MNRRYFIHALAVLGLIPLIGRSVDPPPVFYKAGTAPLNCRVLLNGVEINDAVSIKTGRNGWAKRLKRNAAGKFIRGKYFARGHVVFELT